MQFLLAASAIAFGLMCRDQFPFMLKSIPWGNALTHWGSSFCLGCRIWTMNHQQSSPILSC